MPGTLCIILAIVRPPQRCCCCIREAGVGETTALSDIIKFKLTAHRSHFKNVIFLNNLGIWESLETTGYWSSGIEVSKEFADTIANHNQTKTVQFNTDSKHTHILRTGYLTTTEAKSIDRLIKSDYIYYMNTEGEWVQLLLNTKAINKLERNRLFNYEFKAVEAIN